MKTQPISDLDKQRLKNRVRELDKLEADAGAIRLEVGRELVVLRKQWPASGPAAHGWGDLLDELGLTRQRAWELMQLAGYVDEHGLSAGGQIPSLRDVGVKAEAEADIEIDRDTWCTPKDLAKALGDWDLDPCANDRSHIQAAREFRLEERGEDGLVLASKVDAKARVFINPPYSDVLPWIQAYAHTRFCFLLKFDPSTKWFAELLEHTEVVFLPRGTRIQFEAPPGVPKNKAEANQFPHALFYAREKDATKAIHEMCFSPWRIL